MKFLDKIVTLDNTSQAVHFLLADWLVEHGIKMYGHPFFWLLLVAGLAGIKEIADNWIESPKVAGNGWKDWSSYVLGAMFAMVFCLFY